MRRRLQILVVVAAAASALAAGTDSRPAGPKADEPVRVSLKLMDGQTLRGLLLRLEEDPGTDSGHVVLDVMGQQRRIGFEQIQPASLYMLKRQVMDLSQASVHVRLGAFCLKHGLKRPAEREFTEALRLDPSLAKEVARVRGEARSGQTDSAPGTQKAGQSTQPAQGDDPVPPPARRPEVAEKDVRKYIPATAEQIEANRRKADQWAKQTAAFARKLHLVQTPHFLIYSAWKRSNDKPLADICERMYAAMCRQFAIPPGENIWAGKCAMYVFWEKQHYQRFCTEVYGHGNTEASGFCGWNSSGFVFIVMGPCRSQDWFYELLVHEATHGFLFRYRTNRNVPLWLHEGLAEYMAATLLKKTQAENRCVSATKEAIRKRRPVTPVLEDVKMNAFDYGIAQSFVRFLIARKRQGFVEFVKLLKDGASEADALKQAYGLSRAQFVREWTRAAARAVAPKRGSR